MANNLEEFGVEVDHEWWCAKKTKIPEGLAIEQHEHEYDHYSWLMKGAVIVNAGGKFTSHTAPCPPILIKAGVKHTVISVVDSVWYCIHDVDMAEFDARDHEAVDLRVVK